MSVTQEHIRRPVHAGGHMNHDQHTPSEREARVEVQQGQGDRSTPRPQWVCKGNLSTREARHQQYDDVLGSRSTPEAKRKATGKSV